jgi:hypothetical protein
MNILNSNHNQSSSDVFIEHDTVQHAQTLAKHIK